MRRVENEGNKRAFWGERTVGSRAMSMGASHNAGGRVSVRRNIEPLNSVVFRQRPGSTQKPLSPVLVRPTFVNLSTGSASPSLPPPSAPHARCLPRARVWPVSGAQQATANLGYVVSFID